MAQLQTDDDIDIDVDLHGTAVSIQAANQP